jgi:hypothetical protein
LRALFARIFPRALFRAHVPRALSRTHFFACTPPYFLSPAGKFSAPQAIFSAVG